MKPTMLDFNKLESQVIRGDYQGLKAQGSISPQLREFHNGKRNRKALFKDLREVFTHELGIWSVSDLSPRQKAYINRILNLKLNETNQLKFASSQTRQLAFVRAVRNYAGHCKFFYIMFEKELKNIQFKEVR